LQREVVDPVTSETMASLIAENNGNARDFEEAWRAENGKSAAAKLKVALPIMPLIASYELELDTENFVLRSWRSIRSLFERLSRPW
jgi:hypothetical protein